jgi:hypothetical protein
MSAISFPKKSIEKSSNIKPLVMIGEIITIVALCFFAYLM